MNIKLHVLKGTNKIYRRCSQLGNLIIIKFPSLNSGLRLLKDRLGALITLYRLKETITKIVICYLWATYKYRKPSFQM